MYWGEMLKTMIQEESFNDVIWAWVGPDILTRKFRRRKKKLHKSWPELANALDGVMQRLNEMGNKAFEELIKEQFEQKQVAVINKTMHGWDCDMWDEDGHQSAGGTSPTLPGILDMVQDYLYDEYHE
jgi:hypothetical protein